MMNWILSPRIRNRLRINYRRPLSSRMMNRLSDRLLRRISRGRTVRIRLTNRISSHWITVRRRIEIRRAYRMGDWLLRRIIIRVRSYMRMLLVNRISSSGITVQRGIETAGLMLSRRMMNCMIWPITRVHDLWMLAAVVVTHLTIRWVPSGGIRSRRVLLSAGINVPPG